MKGSQCKSCNVENVCLASALDIDILLLLCRVTGISVMNYFCAKRKFHSSMGPAKIKINRDLMLGLFP